MRHLELFAGIGGFRRAMDILTNDHIMEFHCIGYSEIDSKVIVSGIRRLTLKQRQLIALIMP